MPDELIIERFYPEPGTRDGMYVFRCKRTDKIVAGITLKGTAVTRPGMTDDLTDDEWLELLQKLGQHEQL